MKRSRVAWESDDAAIAAAVPGFGLEATGVDCREPLTDAAFAEIERAFFDGQVLALRGQR